ncbi:Lrp/AsnC family transcriptional regulator [Erythrobacter insulae]|uniref:Lrp/AsnC family transcriptional regulator n=1 Tax=Erythrobacter insulae TaxID=2584124 RepID=A0A547PAP0_9SPHN|nr:Lrp/AsnC family transcriptional regulator [Erythrobacter insulae]TRD11222.1 Lrp/AsnC family transcriptional regulator [Erythrobacter insulae]
MNESHQPPLDEADRRILREVQKDIRRSPEMLADAVGMSVSSFRRRLKRLRSNGRIKAEVALIEPETAGIEIVVVVTMREEHSADYDRLKRRIREAPEITQCYSVTGEVDLILHVIMPGMERFEAWLQEYVLQDKAVRRCTSHVVYSRIKYETALPI